MNLYRLRRRCEAVLRDIVLPEPFDLESMCQQVAGRRGRPLRFVVEPALAGGNGPCGLWVATDAEDLVFVEPAISVVHREHIALHELGHMLAGHDGRGSSTADHLMARLLPSLDPATVRMVLGRAAYCTIEEQEAEMIASLITARAHRTARPEPHITASVSDHGVLERLSALLDEPAE